MSNSILFAFSGLPGVGKSSLAELLANQQKGMWLRIDTIEQSLCDLCHLKVESEGYRLAYQIAKDNLKVGNHVIADCCNPIELTRREWIEIANECGSKIIDIEVICTDIEEHKLRVNNRKTPIKNLILPTWEEVQLRYYEQWTTHRIVIDTAHKTIEESFNDLNNKLSL